MKMQMHLLSEIIDNAIPFHHRLYDYESLAHFIGDARLVLIGESTHGSEDFYKIRAELTRMLIAHHGFDAVAVEGDWPDCYRANRYVRGSANIPDSRTALTGFQRFPAWMWRNNVMVEFLDWLKDHNAGRLMPQEKVGFYGLDLYSLHASIEAVIAYLEKVDPAGADAARHHYGCFDHHYAENPQQYGLNSFSGAIRSCESDVVRQLAALRQSAHDYIKRDGFAAGEEFFCAEQNARVAVRAEEYYRTMFAGRVSSWNLRDSHMVETLNAIAGHLSDVHGREAKIVVWAHNSHVGDARATEMGDSGEHNIGQLVREQFGTRQIRLIGFSTSRGNVTAASRWDGEAECKTIIPAMDESYEGLFHDTNLGDFWLDLRKDSVFRAHINLMRLQRAIGVLYLPQSERRSHYFFARLADQFDALIHIDRTTALRPLETTPRWHKGEVYETYPSGL